jgi:hypothetical protein
MLVVVVDTVKMPAGLTALAVVAVLPIAEAEVLLIAAELLALLLFLTPAHKKALVELLHRQAAILFIHLHPVAHTRLNYAKHNQCTAW